MRPHGPGERSGIGRDAAVGGGARDVSRPTHCSGEHRKCRANHVQPGTPSRTIRRLRNRWSACSAQALRTGHESSISRAWIRHEPDASASVLATITATHCRNARRGPEFAHLRGPGKCSRGCGATLGQRWGYGMMRARSCQPACRSGAARNPGFTANLNVQLTES
jgi:hypothetical protein